MKAGWRRVFGVRGMAKVAEMMPGMLLAQLLIKTIPQLMLLFAVYASYLVLYLALHHRNSEPEGVIAFLPKPPVMDPGLRSPPVG